MERLRVPLSDGKGAPISVMTLNAGRLINGDLILKRQSDVGTPGRIMRRAFLLSFACIFICSSSTAWPLTQEGPAADTLASRADSLLAAKQFAAAKDLYEQILDQNDSSVVALKGMGRIAFAEKSWSSAVSWFERASESVPNDLEARYYLGCAHGERGRDLYVFEMISSGFEMISSALGISTNFEKAEEDFRWVTARDSSYRDAFYQLAIVYRYKHEYPNAITHALKQVEVTPDLRIAPLGLFRIYREAIGMAQGATPPERLLRPTSDYDKFFYADWQRRKGQPAEAEKSLLALLEKPGLIRPQIILQSLARLKASQKSDEDAEQYVLEAISLIQTMGDADLVFEDIKYIITDDELHRYQSLTNPTEAKKFFAAFWAKRNPHAAANTNARIGEHCRRLAYAEEHFQQFGRKTYSQGSGDTWMLNFPESYYLNEELNDKGLIYLHHGEPDRKITTSSLPNDRRMQPNESWLYQATGDYPEMLFDFVISTGAHVGEWRLVPIISDPAYWNDRADFSRKYSGLLFDPQSETGIARNLAGATDEGKSEVSTGLATERFSFGKNIKYFQSPISITCYRGSNGKTLMDLGYVIVPAEMTDGAVDSARTLKVDALCSLYDLSWKRTTSYQRSRVYALRGRGGNAIIEMFRVTVAPDSYFVAWEARPEGATIVASQKIKALIPDFSGRSLNISDIELAYAIEPAKRKGEFNKGSLSVVPNPLRRSPIDRPLHLYFEAYNLSKDRNGRTKYTVEYGLTSIQVERSFLAKIFGSGKKTSITVPTERVGNEDWSAEHVDLDVSELEAGKYELHVKVTDNLTKTSVSRSLSVEIYQPN
ncbi:MAG: GWxTD domain-containing protein [Ignavibacteriales bacterium]|nr:GWxTD domain-containing protein [Ignavibacteriales bacterium]